jgi:hypothetical protein
MLRYFLHAPRGHFYSPKAARSRWRQTCKAILAFCRVVHWTATVACPVRDFLPNRAQSTVAASGPLAHRTLSGAHRTVRCPPPTVGVTTCRAKIARPTVGAGMPPLKPESGEFTANQPGAPDSPVCQTERRLAAQSQAFQFLSLRL